MTECINAVLIEHLPLLQCCNVYIQYSQSPGAGGRACQFAINNAHIHIDGHAIELPAMLRLRPATLSRYFHTADHISFRVCTDRSAAPGADEEIVLRPQRPAHSVCHGRARPQRMPEPSVRSGERVQLLCMECKEPISEWVRFGRVLPLPSDNMDSAEWFCHDHAHGHGHGHGEHEHAEAPVAPAKPKETLGSAKAAEAFFQRPADWPDSDSDDVAMVDAQAAAAERAAAAADEPPVPALHIPSNAARIDGVRDWDLLYGQYFCVLRRQVLNAELAVRNGRYLHCACGHKLGEAYGKRGTVRLWNDVVCYTLWGADRSGMVGSNGKIMSQAPVMHLFAGSPRDHFVRILQRIIEDYDFDERSAIESGLALPQTVRALFTSFSSDDEAGDDQTIEFGDDTAEPHAGQTDVGLPPGVRQTVLLVQVMNPALDVWRFLDYADIEYVDAGDDDDDDEDGAKGVSVDEAQQTISLRRQSIMKVMYCLIDLAPGQRLPPLVEHWHADPRVHSVELCDRLLHRAALLLTDNSALLPEFYREQTTGGFRMSYLW